MPSYKAMCDMGRSIVFVVAFNSCKQYLYKHTDLFCQCQKKAAIINQMFNYTIFDCVAEQEKSYMKKIVQWYKGMKSPFVHSHT